ncbi:MAG: hypothetical protein KJ043_11515 [Anaerolineae bacterium]|nr:hypothetical protein [Anaerolineae bacterium]
MSDSTVPRRQFLAMLGAGATLGVGLHALQTDDITQEQTPVVTTPTPLPAGVKSIIGTWFGQIFAEDGVTLLFRGMATFMSGGTMMTTGQNDVAPEPRGTGHGVWRQDGRHVDNRLLKFLYNSDLQLIGIYEEFLSGDMDETGDIFVADATVNIYDLEGNLTATRTGLITAKRFSLTQPFGF